MTSAMFTQLAFDCHDLKNSALNHQNYHCCFEEDYYSWTITGPQGRTLLYEPQLTILFIFIFILSVLLLLLLTLV